MNQQALNILFKCKSGLRTERGLGHLPDIKEKVEKVDNLL